MRPFHFSLEQVLRFRQQQEEQAMLLFAQALQAKEECLARRNLCLEEIAAQRTRLAQADMVNPAERWLLSSYVDALLKDLAWFEHELLQREERLDACRVELTRKSQDKKLLEKLKEKQALRQAEAENYKEQKNYDDIATMRFTPPAF